MSEHSAEKGPVAVEFSGNDLDRLLKVHELVFGLAETAEARVVVEVWSVRDDGPVAWLEVHPSDSEVRVTFIRPDHEQEARDA